MSGSISEDSVLDIWPSVLPELRTWVARILSNPWTPAIPDDNTPHQFVLASDASLRGYGGVLFDEVSGSVWEVAGRWERERSTHTEIKQSSKGAPLLLLVDNPSTRATLKGGSAYAYLLNDAIREALSTFSASQKVTVAYVTTEENPADGPSRGDHVSSQLASALGPLGRRLASSALRVAVPCSRSLSL